MNQIILIGNIKEKPLFKTTTTGLNLATVLIEKNDNSDMYQFTFWNQNSEYVKDNIKEGDKVIIKGHLKANNFLKDDNEIYYRCELIGDRISVIN